MIRSARDLPFVERSVAELLGIAPGRAAVDEDFEGFGWARVPELWLETSARAGDGPTRRIRDAIVLALHSSDSDEGTAVGGSAAEGAEVDLEFRVDGEVLVVGLGAFLEAWIPRLPAAAPHWVLALCNPRSHRLARPAGLAPETAVWYAAGNVDAWSEGGSGQDARFGLTADQWIRL